MEDIDDLFQLKKPNAKDFQTQNALQFFCVIPRLLWLPILLCLVGRHWRSFTISQGIKLESIEAEPRYP